MAFETTTYGPRDKADKKPKWQVTPFNFAKVKKVTEPKTEQPVIRQDNGIVQDQPNQPIEQTTDQPKLGMGDLKQAESEGTVDFFDQKPPRNINDLYQTPQDATKAPVYDYNKLNDLPITKKVYKERINNPENREPTYPISQPVETPSGSYEAADMEPKLQEEEIRQKAEIVNKINSGEINIPPFVSSLPMDMQLGYVGATYNNNPLYTSLTTLMEPLLHLDNLVRSGMNKAFSTDYKMLTPPNMSGEDEDDKLITGGTELLTSLIPLGASIKGANYLLRGVKNPFLNKILSTGLGFVINSQPALLDNLQQGNMELKDYAMQSATDFVTGLTFGAMPPGMPLKYDIPYQTVVPTMVPVISDLIQGKPVDEKEIVNGFLSNMILGLVMSGQLPKNTKVDEVSRQVKTELNKYNEAQQTPELVNQIISGLLGPARETNSETISRIKTGEKPSIEQINIPGDKSRIVVDEKGTAQIDPEREAQPYIAPIKLTEEQYNDMKRGGLTDAEIREAQDYLNGKINRTEKTTDPENIVRQDNGIKPENNSLKSEPEKPAEQPPVKTEPEREYKTVKLDAEDIGSKYIVDEKGNMFVVKKEKEGYYEKYVLYRKTPEQTQPERLSSFMNEHSVNLGLRSWAEGDMFLKSRPADKVEQQKPADERTTQQKKAEDAYSNMLDLRDEVNSVKKSDLSGRANKSNNIRLLKKNVDDYNANHPDNKAKIERTKWGTYNIFINGKPLRRESVKREFNVEDKAGEIDNPNANKPYKELGAEEREVQRKIAQNIIDADPSVVKNRAGFETPMKVFRKGLEDIKDDSGKEQSPEAQIVRQEMLEKTDNGKEYREKVSEPEKNNGQDNRIDTNNYELNNFVGEKYYPNETKAKKEHDLGIEVYSYTIKKYRKAFDGEKNVDAFDIELSNGNIKTLKAEDVITQILSDKNSFKPDNNGLIKTKNGRHNGIKNEEKNLFEKMSLAEIEKHVNDKAKELGSRADYLRSDEYKELIKPVYDKLLEQRKKDLISKVKSVKEEAKNNVISKQEYKSKMDNIKHEMQMKEERLKEKVEEKPVPKPEMKEEAKQDQPEGTTKKQAEEIINDFGEKLFGSRKDEATPLGKRTRTKNSDLKKGDYEALEMTEADSNGMELRIGSDINSETGTGKYMIVKDGSILMKDVPNRDMAARMLSAMVVKDKFKVYKKADEDYRIYKRFANGKIADVPTLTFKNEADAKIYMIQKADELLEMSKFEHFKRPHLEKLERIGDKTREGNATPKMFTDTFGFRGVEFGKWVENAERQDILNQAYDSFHDLAKILKLPPEALSLNGELGIGFGSRGHGGFNSATAHYEPKRVVINLTKLKGDGSLAHEYFHALDNYFYLIDNEVKLDRDEKGVLKNSRGLFKSEYSNTGKLNKVLANKFHDIYEQLSKREEVREVNLNKEKARLDTMNNNLKEALDYTRDFLSKPDKYRKKKAAATPEQLKRIDELNARILKGDYGDRVYIQPNKRSMYDLGRNTFKYIEELSIIYKTVTGREGWKAYRGLDEIGHAVKRISDQKARYEAYLKDNKENVKVKSKYVEEALKLDQMRGSPYYTKTIELMARAFESYAYDKITESGKRSDYLVHSVENKYFPPSALFGIKIKPYPEGVERTNINKAFDSFFEKLNQYSEYKEGLKLEYEEAKSLLKKTILSDRADFLGLSRLGDLADTKVLKAIYKVGEYHLESGLVKFGDWAKKMVKELGDKVKPHLKNIWNEINNPKNVKAFKENNPDAELHTSGPSMKLKNEETFEQYKKRIAKEYGTVPSREEYNDAKELQVTNDKLQENKVKTELEGVLNDVVNAPVNEKTLDELRSRTSKRKKNAPANEVYMDKVYSKMSEIQADMEKRGYKGQSLMNQSEIQSIKHLFNNDPEFKKFKAEQKRAIVREIKNYYKEEYRKRTAANAVLGEEYQDKNIWHRIKNSSFLQSLTHIGRQGPSGKEMATRFRKMADQERELMGEPSGLLLDIEGLSKAEKNNLEKIWEQKMNEQIPMNYLNDNVKNLDAKIDDYFENMANMYKERGFITRNLLTGDVYGFTPKRDYRPRIMNDKVSELELKEDNSGIPKANKQREKVIDFLIETRQAKDRAAAAILLDNELSKHRIRKAGNVEYSRNEKLRLPDEYYVTDPTKSLLSYAKKVSKRVAFVDSWGMEGQIFNRLRDDLYKEGRDYQRANDLFRYETGQLTAKERKSLHDVNNVKALMALTKFSPFTSLRNAFQGFLGTTTRGNLKAGFTGLVNSLKPTIIKNAYEAGVMADNLEGVFKDTAGSGNNNFLGDLTTKYLDLIKFTATDRYNRVISGVGGLSFMEDMMKRIKKDSVWKRRARREFEKLNIDPDKVIENGGFTQAEKNKIMCTFAFDSQFSLRPQDLPLWWSSPMGKMVTQWKPWGYKMTQLIRDNVISEVRHGNIAPLVTMLTAYGITGEAVNYIIDNIRSTANFNPNEDDKKKETPNEKSLIGKINEGDLDGVTKRVIEDLSGLGAMSMYWDIIRSYGYGKYGQGISVLAGPAYGEAGSIVENVFGPTLKKLALKSNDPWEDVTKKTIKGLFKSTTGNVPGAGTFRTLGITKALEDYLFKNDEPNFQDDSVIGEYYKGLDDPGKEEVKKIKEMEKDLKAFREQVLSNPTKEMQREFQKKESEIKRYKDKSRVWYNYTKIKSTKEKEESKKLGK